MPGQHPTFLPGIMGHECHQDHAYLKGKERKIKVTRYNDA